MDTVTQHQVDLLILEDEVTFNVVSSTVETVVQQGDHSTIVIANNGIGNILTEVTTAKSIVTGVIGPPGPSAEEIDVYSKRVDFISETELYKGEAAVGSSEASAVWRIRKLTIAVDGDVVEIWADGDANFDNVWANRASLTYM